MFLEPKDLNILMKVVQRLLFLDFFLWIQILAQSVSNFPFCHFEWSNHLLEIERCIDREFNFLDFFTTLKQCKIRHTTYFVNLESLVETAPPNLLRGKIWLLFTKVSTVFSKSPWNFAELSTSWIGDNFRISAGLG